MIGRLFTVPRLLGALTAAGVFCWIRFRPREDPPQETSSTEAPVPDPYNTEATCQAIREAEIPIDLGKGRGGLIEPFWPEFQARCRGLLNTAAEEQQRRVGRVQIWQSPLLQTARDFLQRHNLRGELIGPDHPSGLGTAIAGVEPGRVSFGLSRPIPQDPQNLQFILDHEAGHLRDRVLIRRFHEDTASWNRYFDGTATFLDLMAMHQAFQSMILERLGEEDRQKFPIRMNRMGGSSPQRGANEVVEEIRLFSELIRAGEEVADPRLRTFAMSTDFVDFKKQGPKMGRGNYHSRIFVRAKLEVAGIWDDFSKLPDFDPTESDDLDPEDLLFCRSAIIAARTYFSTPSQ